LLQPIQGFLEAEYPVGVLLHDAFWLLHVDLLLEFVVKESIGNVNTVQNEVLNGSKSKDGSEGSLFGGRRKRLVVFKPWSLPTSRGNKACLVALNGPVCIAFHFEDPSGAYRTASWGKLHKLEGPVLHQCLDFLYGGIIPLSF
jgi:hypothetical protein